MEEESAKKAKEIGNIYSMAYQWSIEDKTDGVKELKVLDKSPNTKNLVTVCLNWLKIEEIK